MLTQELSREDLDREAFFKEELKKRYDLIEETLSLLIPVEESPYREIFSAARYSLLAGGKRLRPLLTIVTAEMFAIPIKKEALIAACSLELIHTYSLIHDDLPCMDNDDFRRGKPSLHKVFKEGVALLTGDYLLTYAFDLLTHLQTFSSDQKLSLISSLAKNSGAEGMIGGQLMDISSDVKEIGLDYLTEIHKQKTGKLIATALEFGAIMGNANAKERALLKQFGLDMGLAFQIVDDILDVTASKEKHGREIASDLINGKTTYLSLLGIAKAEKLAAEISEKAIASLKELPYDVDFLTYLAKTLVHRMK